MGLNQSRHNQLNVFTHNELFGMPHFAVKLDIHYDRDLISRVSGRNICNVSFKSDTALSRWECRAVRGSGSVLISSGGMVGANANVNFTVNGNQLINGDGVYEINITGVI